MMPKRSDKRARKVSVDGRGSSSIGEPLPDDFQTPVAPIPPPTEAEVDAVLEKSPEENFAFYFAADPKKYTEAFDLFASPERRPKWKANDLMYNEAFYKMWKTEHLAQSALGPTADRAVDMDLLSGALVSASDRDRRRTREALDVVLRAVHVANGKLADVDAYPHPNVALLIVKELVEVALLRMGVTHSEYVAPVNGAASLSEHVRLLLKHDIPRDEWPTTLSLMGYAPEQVTRARLRTEVSALKRSVKRKG